jgi:probable O-glycosylation ligase (exosortase A-associated)
VYYGLLLFFILEYVRPNNYLPVLNVLHLNTVVPVGIVVISLLSHGRITTSDVLREPNTRMILVLLGLIVVSILTADVTLYAFNVFSTVVGYALVTWVIAKQITELQQIKGIFKTLVLVHIVVAVLTPQLFATTGDRPYIASGSFLGDGNDFSLSVNMAIPMCLFLLFDARSTVQRLLYGSALLILVLSVVGTSSRGGTLALACVGFYYWLKSEKKVVMAVVAGAAVALVFVFAPPTYFNRMETIGDPMDGSAQGRILAWKAGIRMALDHPALGVGAGHFPVKYGVEYRPPNLPRTAVPWQTAHSNYFVILGELGFPGLAVLLLFIGSNFSRNRRLTRVLKDRDNEGAVADTRLLNSLSASLVAFVVGGAFLTAIYYPHMYVLAGLLIVARRVVLDRNGTSEAEIQVPWGSVAPYRLAAR